jgi:hypothetical protein
MAKTKDHLSGATTPAANPEQLAREIESFLLQKQTSIAQSIDQLLQHKKDIDRKAEMDKLGIDGQVEKLNDLYFKATNRYYVSSKKNQDGAPVEARSGRRSRKELETDAAAIVEFVQSKGTEGVGGGEIKERFPRITGGIKDFVKKYTGVTLQTEGEKSLMRYFGT